MIFSLPSVQFYCITPIAGHFVTDSNATLECNWNIFYRLDGEPEIEIATIENALQPEAALIELRRLLEGRIYSVLGLMRQEFFVNDLD